MLHRVRSLATGMTVLAMIAGVVAFGDTTAGAAATATLTGTITDATTGTGISGAVIDLYQPGTGTNGVANAVPKPFLTVTAGAGGVYSTSVAAGTYYVEALGATGSAYGALFAGGISDWRVATPTALTAGASSEVDLALPRWATFGGTTTTTSVTGVGQNYAPAVYASEDGQTVALAVPDALVPQDTNPSWDVYLHSLATGTNTLVDRTASGAAPSTSTLPEMIEGMSDDGTVVAFDATATDQVGYPGFKASGFPGEEGYVFNATTGQTTGLSDQNGGTKNVGDALAVSGNGRYVAYSYTTPTDVQLKILDLQTGLATSVANNDASPGADITSAALSYDGSTVAWRTGSIVYSQVLPGGSVTQVATGATDTSDLPFPGRGLTISDDGRYETYESANGPASTGGQTAIYRWDATTATATLVTQSSAGLPLLKTSKLIGTSPDGNLVLFATSAPAVTAGSPVGLAATGTPIYLRDMATGTNEWIDVPLPGPIVDDSIAAGAVTDSGLVYFGGTTDSRSQSTDFAPAPAGQATTSLMERQSTLLSGGSTGGPPPSYTCAAPPSGWFAVNVGVTCTADDPSQLQSPADATILASTHVASGITNATAPLTSDTSPCGADGTCTVVTASATAEIDRQAPTAAITTPETGTTYIQGSRLTASYACADVGSGVATCSGPAANGATLATSTLGPQTFTVTATDVAGNQSTQSSTYTVVPNTDATPPTITCDPVPAGWVNANVTLHCTASDASGLADPDDAAFTLATTVAAGTSSADASTSSHQVCDIYGNCATAGPYGGIQVDLVAPTISVTSPTTHETVIAGRVSAGFTCADADSGIASCVGSVGNGATLPTTPGTQTLTITATDAAGNTSTTTVPYAVVAAVTGTITDASNGAAVAGVNVRFYPHGSSTMTTSAVTAADGTYSVGVLPAGSYDVALAKSGTDATRWLPSGTSQVQAQPVTIGATAATVNGTVVPVADAEVAGTVTASESGAPLAGATVNLYAPGATAPLATTTTAGDGTYRLPARPAGSYELQVQAANRVDRWWTNAEVRAQDTTLTLAVPGMTANFALPIAVAPTGTIIGTVTDAITGLPVSGVNVRAWIPSAKAYLAATTTAGDGSYQLSGMAPGTYQLEYAKSGGYATTWWRYGTTQATATTITFDGVAVRADATILPLGQTQIGGVVTGADTKAALAGTQVTAYAHGTTTPVATATTGSDGHYAIVLPSGTYDLEATATGYNPTWWTAATTQANATPIVASGSSQASFTLTVNPNIPSSIYGHVTDAATGTPVAGANVRLWVPGAKNYLLATVTDGNGNYSFLNVPNGTYQLQFAKSGSYLTAWWNGASTQGASTPVVENGTVLDLNALLTHS